jgi:hypothetical protein
MKHQSQSGGISALDLAMRRTLAFMATVLVAACGGGASLSADPASTAPLPVKAASLSGSIVKGPVAGAQVCAYALVPSGKGKQLGCANSNPDGTYALELDFEGEVVVEATGGSYTDEASGLTGVPLGAPLQSVTSLGRSANVLHATPLTALAFSRALAAGDLSLAAFQAKADLVRNAFGLAPEVDLARTLPTVSGGSVNAYGTALHGLSKMLGMGATLVGIVGNDNIDALKRGFDQAAQCVAQPAASLAPSTPVPAPVLTGGIHWEDPTGLPGPVVFTVTQPTAAWRSLLPTSGEAMGCQLGENTAARVVLSCPSTAMQSAVTLLADLAATDALTPPALPPTGVLVMGQFIHGLGMVPNTAILTLDTGWRNGVPVGGAIAAGGAISTGGTIASPSGALCGTNTLTASGILQGGGNIGTVGTTGPVATGGTITLSSGTGFVPSGNVVVNGGSVGGTSVSTNSLNLTLCATSVSGSCGQPYVPPPLITLSGGSTLP